MILCLTRSVEAGTTLVQANEFGMHAIGIDISVFNAFISNAKLAAYNLPDLYEESQKITVALKNFVATSGIVEFESKLAEMLADFNNQYFPVSFKRQVRAGEINQKQYGAEKEAEFLKTYHELVSEYQIDVEMPIDSADSDRFMKQWYLPGVRAEIDFVYSLIRKVEDPLIQNALMLILSRTIRSCRATTHADLGTLRKPMTTTYYCRKHGKICKPLFSIFSWWERYCKDSVQRWVEFGKLKTNTFQHCITGDARTIDIFTRLKHIDSRFSAIAQKQRIKGIFTSPPYVGTYQLPRATCLRL